MGREAEKCVGEGQRGGDGIGTGRRRGKRNCIWGSKRKKIEEIVMMSIIYSKESQGQHLNNQVIKESSLMGRLLYSCEK